MKEKMLMREKELNKILEKEGKQFRVKYTQKWKINEVKEGYILLNSDSNISPVIYNEDKIMRMSDQELIEYMEEIIENSDAPDAELIIQSLQNKEYVKNNIYFDLLSLQKNIKSLKQEDILFMPVEDMVITFYILIKLENSTGKIRITNNMLEKLNLTIEDAFRCAKDNLSKNYNILDVKELLKQEIGNFPVLEKETHNNGKMLVVTTKYGNDGAALMLVDKVIEEISKCLSSEFLIIPSSIHEFIAIPYQTEDDIKNCRQIVHEVNSMVLPENEYLSDNVFVWKNGKLYKA